VVGKGLPQEQLDLVGHGACPRVDQEKLRTRESEGLIEAGI